MWRCKCRAQSWWWIHRLSELELSLFLHEFHPHQSKPCHYWVACFPCVVYACINDEMQKNHTNWKEKVTKFRDEIPFWKSKAAAVAHADSLKLNPCFWSSNMEKITKEPFLYNCILKGQGFQQQGEPIWFGYGYYWPPIFFQRSFVSSMCSKKKISTRYETATSGTPKNQPFGPAGFDS